MVKTTALQATLRQNSSQIQYAHGSDNYDYDPERRTVSGRIGNLGVQGFGKIYGPLFEWRAASGEGRETTGLRMIDLAGDRVVEFKKHYRDQALTLVEIDVLKRAG